MNLDPTYLGDGVYASNDGWHIWLHLGSHDSPPLIALEPAVINALLGYFIKTQGEQL